MDTEWNGCSWPKDVDLGIVHAIWKQLFYTECSEMCFEKNYGSETGED